MENLLRRRGKKRRKNFPFFVSLVVLGFCSFCVLAQKKLCGFGVVVMWGLLGWNSTVLNLGGDSKKGLEVKEGSSIAEAMNRSILKLFSKHISEDGKQVRSCSTFVGVLWLFFFCVCVCCLFVAVVFLILLSSFPLFL